MAIEPYDERFDSKGELRAAVATFDKRTGIDSGEPTIECVEALTRHPLDDEARILPMPLILQDHEYTTVIAEGVRQRALALQLLFQDLFVGPRSVIERRGLFTHSFVEQVVVSERWTSRDISRLWAGKGLRDIRFVYGPDLVRDQNGRWLVLEDNIGCLGGVGDADPILRTFLGASGSSLHPRIPTHSDLEAGVKAFLNDAGVALDDARVVAFVGESPTSAACGDLSLLRKASVLKDLGVATGAPGDYRPGRPPASTPSAVVNLGGTSGGPCRDAVGALFAQGSMPVLNAPGLGVLASKAFLPYVDEVVRYLLREEPILTAPRTRFADVSLTALPPDGVLKRINGCGGSEVFFLADHRGQRAERLTDLVASWGHGQAILQDFVTSSILPVRGPGSWSHYRVELRPITYVVGGGAAQVSDQPVARAASNLGDRRGNLTRGSHHLAVVREPLTP